MADLLEFLDPDTRHGPGFRPPNQQARFASSRNNRRARTIKVTYDETEDGTDFHIPLDPEDLPAPPTRQTDLDPNVDMMSEDEDTSAPSTVDGRITALYRQFANDLLEKAPAPKNGPPYFLLTGDDDAPYGCAWGDGPFAEADLKSVWSNASLRTGPNTWNSALLLFFPITSNSTFSTKAQGWPTLSYLKDYFAWRSEWDAQKRGREFNTMIRAALITKIQQKFRWLPDPDVTRVWITRSSGKASCCPAGQGLAPKLAINPAYCKEIRWGERSGLWKRIPVS
jgi:hypothetical protein